MYSSSDVRCSIRGRTCVLLCEMRSDGEGRAVNRWVKIRSTRTCVVGLGGGGCGNWGEGRYNVQHHHSKTLEAAY